MPLYNQQCAENVEHPMKAVDQSNPGADENAAQHERADDSPEKNAMLLLFRERQK